MDSGFGIDTETLNLIVKLQLEEFDELARTNAPKGKCRAGEQDARTDFMAALAAYRDDLAATAQVIADEAMCRSIAGAVEADADLIGTALAEEEQANQDRDLAYSLSGQTRPAAHRHRRNSQASCMSTAATEDMLDRLRALNLTGSVYHDDDGDDYDADYATSASRAESSSRAASRAAPSSLRTAITRDKPPARRPCIACAEHHPPANLARTPACGHDYCSDCLRSLFTASLSDETLFPPKCCRQPIPPAQPAVRALLTHSLLAAFAAKQVEFDTPVTERTYCHARGCSAFVPRQFVAGGVAHCPRPGCAARTCAVCKGPVHRGSDCPEDPATQEMLRLAESEGWQQCRGCRRFVELDTGCNHITCRCGAEFCYVCGERWKTCTCPQWNEERLYTRANEVVNRDARHAPERVRAAMVEREQAHLREYHECQHASWRSRGGRHQCEECYDTLPNYIYECNQCRIMACRRCRFNRL